MWKTDDKVTVITVCYNAAGVIEKTLHSVTSQTWFRNIEYIVIDGGSTDGTLDILRRYEDRFTVFVSEPDRGIYNAMNKGIARSTGRFINFMNAGDTFFNDRVVEDVARYMAGVARPFNIVYGSTVYGYPGGYRVGHPDPSMLPSEMGCCHQSMWIDGDLLRGSGYDESFRIRADFEFIHRMCVEGKARVAVVPRIIAVYTMDGISSLSRTAVERRRELCRILGRRFSMAGYYFKAMRVTLGEKRLKLMTRLGLKGGLAPLRPLSEIEQMKN